MLLRHNRSVDWNKLDDGRLWDYLRKGHEEALSELFSRYYQSLLRYGIRLINEGESVRDGIQELFLNMWKRHTSLSKAESVRIYLFVSLRRLLLRRYDHSRSRKKREQLYYIEEWEEYSPPMDQMLISVETNSQLRKQLQACIQTLPHRQKEALFLRLNQGLTNDEIANVMEITNQRVRSLISEAIQRLKAEMLHKPF